MTGAVAAAGAGALACLLLRLLVRCAPAPAATRRLLVALAAAGSATGAIAAAPAATGAAPVDAALRALVGGGLAALGAWAGPWPIVAAAGLALVGAGPSAWLAAGALGAAATVAAVAPAAPAAPAAQAPAPATPGRRHVGRAVPDPALALAAGLAAQGALRLSWPRPSLATAALAAAVVVVAGAAGLARLPAGARRAVARAGVVVAGGALLAGAAGAASAASARGPVERGVAAATAGLAQAGRGDEAGAARSLAGAARSLAVGRSRLDAWWARPALAVPVVARHTRALRAMAAAGTEVAGAGARALGTLEEADLALRDGAVPVERLAALRPPLADAGRRLGDAVTRLDAVRSPWLVAPVAGRLDRLSRRAAEGRAGVDDALVALDVAPRLLGANGPRRWFLAVQTPAEARASGGFIGNFAEISAEGGRLRLERVGRTPELTQGGRPDERTLDAPPDYTARYGRFEVDRLWQNVTMSPDFPTVAGAIADLYPQSGGRPVDGVVAIDPLGLAALLGALGPVEVPGWPVPISADNAEEVLLFEQYVRLAGDARVDFLGHVVAAVWGRLTTTDASALALARALGPAVAAKHLLVASTGDAGEAAALARLGVSGAMAPVRGDFLGVVTQNASANKIDWFLRRSVDYSARLDPATGTVRATLRVTLRNDAPAKGLPAYVIGNGARPPVPPGSNKLYLSVYTPLQLTRAAVDGAQRPVESQLERRRHVYSTYVTVPSGGTAVVELELEGRLAAGAGRYRLDLHRQPFLAPDAVTATVGVPEGWRVGRPQVRLALDGDRRLETVVRRAE